MIEGNGTADATAPSEDNVLFSVHMCDGQIHVELQERLQKEGFEKFASMLASLAAIVAESFEWDRADIDELFSEALESTTVTGEYVN